MVETQEVTGFLPDVLSYNDYYPYGMLTPGRHASDESYRYGFNGKEKDDELKGEGNSYDFGARLYDSRIGRWFKQDAYEKKYPSHSPYSFAINSPVSVIDPDGNDIVIIGNKEYREKVIQVLKDLYNKSSVGREALKKIMSSDKVIVIVENKDAATSYNGYGSEKAEGYMVFNYEENATLDPGNGIANAPLEDPPILVMAHEIGHVLQDFNGELKKIGNLKIVNKDNPLRKNPNFKENGTDPKYFTNGIKAPEVGGVEFENKVRAELGYELRTHYGGMNVFEKKISSKIYTFRLFSKDPLSQYSTPLLLKGPKFDYKIYNSETSTQMLFEYYVQKIDIWSNEVKATEESWLNYGFSSERLWPEIDLANDKATRLTTDKKNDKK